MKVPLRHTGAGMAQGCSDVHYVLAVGDGEGCKAVTQVVKPHRSQGGRFACPGTKFDDQVDSTTQALAHMRVPRALEFWAILGRG